MAYLIDNPPARQQFYATRNRPLTGCTVLHTAESLMDTVGPDTGAENVANFIRTRTTPGSYHDLADSDSYINLVPYRSGAFHDGTGSNNWALSISFACATSDWRRMSADKRAGFLRNGARAFADQQAWRRANGQPLTELRYITKAQSDAGWSGFCCHGWRDPGRRTDPGVAAPNEFPFDEWLDHCRAALAGETLEEIDMSARDDIVTRQDQRIIPALQRLEAGIGALVGVTGPRHVELVAKVDALAEVVRQLGEQQGTPVDMDAIEAVVERGVADAIAGIDTTVTVKPA